MSNVLTVVVLGVGVVFIGLISIVILCKIMSAFCKGSDKNDAVQNNVTVPPVQNAPIQNRQEILAGVCAVIAEELGTDIEALKVISFKKI
ncbi:MAG: OadG family transporter subunit [Oscillospiraceae bacterium]|nr:OadG family transporter subunit [Oscillospiraceae bacterium]